MIRTSRLRSSLFILLCIATVTSVSAFVLSRLPSLVEDLAYFVDAPEPNTRLFLLNATRIALTSKNSAELDAFIQEASRLPHIKGIVIADKDNHIVSGAWLGEGLSDVHALKKMIGETWQRWPVEGEAGTIAYVNVAFDAAWHTRLKDTVVQVCAVTVAGIFFLAFLASRSARDRLAQKIKALNYATSRIAHGDYSVRLPTGGQNPVARLSQNFNHMVQELDRFTNKVRTSEERFELAVNGSNDGIWDWDVQTNRLYLSPRFRTILGYGEHEFPGMFNAWKRLIHPEDEPRVSRAIEHHFRKNKPFRCELRLKTKQGRWLWMLGRGEAVRDADGAPVRMAGSFTDITELKATERALALEKERAQVTLHSIADAVITTDDRGWIKYMNPQAEKLTGWSSGTASDHHLLKVFKVTDEERKPIDEGVLDGVLQHGRVVKFSNQTQLRSTSGKRFAVEENAAPLRDQKNQITGMVVVFHDITERLKLWEALQKERELALVTLQSIGDGVITTDVDGRIVYINPTAEQLTGWNSRDAESHPIETVLTLLDEFGASSIATSVQKALSEEQAAIDLGQAALLSLSGEKHIVEHNIAPLRDKTKKVIGGVLVVHNVTDRHKLMKQLSYQATHDSLTQLINRIGFELRLDKTLKSAALNSGVQHVVCYMDLDQFKIVNDTCGHSAGDELLRQVAALLKVQVRKGDTLARLGGDEFGLLLESCAVDNAVEITQKILKQVESFRFVWEDKTFSVGISIGVAPIDGTPGCSVAKVLSTVDQACYIAKSKGRNQLHIYQPGDDESSRWHNEMQWVPHIHRALDEGHFILFAQPIASIGSREEKCEHYEILLRMKDNRGNMIAPGSFLPAAERYGLMPTLDRWVVGKAIDMLAEAWKKDSSFGVSTFGVNISGAVLSDNALLRHVKHTLDAHGLPPSLLCFEITETVAIANFSHANRFVNELKEMGCRFALDDFGSGFASFSYLKTLPVDYLKIDGSFVRHLTENPVDQTMVEVINQLGHVMGLETIAEFVETEEVLDALQRLGVDYAQGYFIGKPVPLHEVCYRQKGRSADRKLTKLA